MSQRRSPAPLWVIGVVIGAFAAVVALGPKSLTPALVITTSALAWVGWRRWQKHRRERSVLRGLVTHWASLAGAEWSRDTVFVHHGDQPMSVKLTHDAGGPMQARISTRIGEQPMAFRIWPSEAPAPRVGSEGGPGSSRALSPCPLVESWLSGRFSAETNDDERFAPLIGEDLRLALVALSDALSGEFEGITYDGQRVSILFRGGIVADPDRALQMARIVWRTLVP